MKLTPVEGNPFKLTPVEGNPFGEAQPSMSAGEVATQAVKNFPGSVKKLAGDIIQPILSPVQTVKGLSSLVSGGVQKLVPGEHEDEETFNQFVGFLKDRYGGVENIKRTIAEDPAGFLADFSLVATGGGAALKGASMAGKVGGLAKAGEVVSAAGKLSDPVRMAAVAAGKTYKGVQKVLPGIAPEKLVMSTLKKAPLSSKLTPEQQLANAQTALEHGIDVGSRSGLEKVWSKMDDMDAAIGSAIDTAAKNGDTISKGDLFRSLQNMKGKGSPYGIHPDKDVFAKVINKTIMDTAKQFPGSQIPVAEVQKLKTNVQQSVRKFYGSKGSIKVEAQKALASDARQALADKYPELAALNKKDAALHQLEKALEGAITRIEARDLMGLGTAVKMGTGGAIGGAVGDVMGAGIGAGAGIALAVLDTPAVKGKLALALDKARRIEARAEYGRAGRARQTSLAAERVNQGTAQENGQPAYGRR
jgi:hypothetical protein